MLLTNHKKNIFTHFKTLLLASCFLLLQTGISYGGVIIQESIDVAISLALKKVSGDNQGAFPETTMSPFKVRVTDIKGNGVKGATIKFEQDASNPSGASLSTAIAVTDVNGEASTVLTIGANTGIYKVIATAMDPEVKYGSPQTFTAYVGKIQIEFKDSIPLKDHQTDMNVPKPEFIYQTRNEPAAYIKNSVITVKVKFTGMNGITSAKIKAEGGLGGLPEQTVSFSGGESPVIEFTANNALPNRISVNNISWNWKCKDVNGSGSEEVSMGFTSHEIYTTNAEPSNPPIYKKPMKWTCEWATGLSDEKDICDAIISNLWRSGLHYGRRGWTVDQILDNGGGMCGGWYKMFQHMCDAQGVFVHAIFYQLKNDAAPPPEVKWAGIDILDPGLNNLEPTDTHNVWWVDNVYPKPRYFGDTSGADDVEYVSNKKVYRFFAGVGDGHCVNFLEYGGQIYLYDPSFGHGPFSNTFTSIPSGDKTGEDLSDFREHYFNTAVDHLYGYIEYDDGIAENPPTYKYLDVKTSLVPDLRVPGDPSTFELHLKFIE
jgi:hypothetical protein